MKWASTEAYDAMGRMTTLTTPNPGGGAYTHTITYDGNGNILKTHDFKGTYHYYQYDALNRMAGHGADSGADDETYTWGSGRELSGYTDSLGTASLAYDDLSRLTSHTDSQGNAVAYAYDALSRLTTLTPPQGTNYRTEYAYKLNGSLDYVRVYDAGNSEDTTYAYDATSGKLTTRDFPEANRQKIRTSYSYDSAGRLQYETVTRESGGTTNLYKTQYAYAYIAAGSGGGSRVTRVEQAWNGGLAAWGNDNQVRYDWDALGRQNYEQRDDWNLLSTPPSWAQKYDITQEYDKNGNRTRLHRNTTDTSTYGRALDLSYTFDSVNALTAMADSDDSTYSAVVTCDANGNITEIEERQTVSSVVVAREYQYYAYDDLNRLSNWRTKTYSTTQGDWLWRKREHGYDGQSALMLCAARLRHIAGTKWGSRKYVVMDPLYKSQLEENAA